MFRPIGKLEGIGGGASYQAFETLTDEQAKQELLNAWSTPEQQEYNRSTTQCPSCRGWGYKIIRRGRETIRETVGCQTCLGLGKLPKGERLQALPAGKIPKAQEKKVA